MDGRHLKHMVSINNPGHNIIIRNIKIEAVKKGFNIKEDKSGQRVFLL